MANFYVLIFADTVPEDLVLIGQMIGDGKVVCFSKSKGNFVRFFEGKVNEEFDDFRDILKEILRILKGESAMMRL